MKSLNYINWTNLLFLVLTLLIGIIATGFIVSYRILSWKTVLLAFFFLFLTGISITAGYHRLFSHRSYQACWLVRLLFLLFATAAFEGSVLQWCTDHRNHHRYTDTERDPYNIHKGFWYAHMGWIFTLDEKKRQFDNVQDLMQDPLARFQHRFLTPLSIFMGFILPALIAWFFWGDLLGGFFIAGALRIALIQQMTFSINSVCHLFGKRMYSDRCTARDNWITAFFTLGEGFHNFHHQFPLDYRNGIRFYHFDPTKWFIWLLARSGLAYNLKRVDYHRIIHYRIEMDRNKVENKGLSNNLNKNFQQLYTSIIQTLSYIDEWEKGRDALKTSTQAVRLAYCKKLECAKSELRYLLKSWRILINYIREDSLSQL